MSDEKTVEAVGWLVFDDSKLVALKKTTRFSLKAGQRAVKVVLEYPESLFEDEYPEVRVPISDKREILDREIGVTIGEDGDETEVVDPEEYVDELIDRYLNEGEVRGMPRWAFVTMRAELDQRVGPAYEYEAGMEEVDGDEAVRVIKQKGR